MHLVELGDLLSDTIVDQLQADFPVVNGFNRGLDVGWEGLNG